MAKKINPNEFRKELKRIMPGYSWTVHRHPHDDCYIHATGVQTSGMNRTSTLSVTKRVAVDGAISYEAKSAGYGLRSPWNGVHAGETLARALRSLQDYYEAQVREYSSLAGALACGRKRARQPSTV